MELIRQQYLKTSSEVLDTLFHHIICTNEQRTQSDAGRLVCFWLPERQHLGRISREPSNFKMAFRNTYDGKFCVNRYTEKGKINREWERHKYESQP